jgi:hypothetical protein
VFIPDPDFYPSWISDLGSWITDPKTATKDRGFIILFFVVTNFTALNLILFLNAEEKILGQFSKNY